MSSVRNGVVLAVVSAALVWSTACSSGSDNGAKGDRPGAGTPTAAPDTASKAPSAGKHSLTLKSGAVCDLVPEKGIEEKTGLNVTRHSNMNSDPVTATEFVDPNVCTYTFDDQPAHSLIVQRLPNRASKDWKRLVGRVKSGENKHGVIRNDLGDGAVDTMGLYMVRVGGSLVQINGVIPVPNQRDKAADDAVAYVIAQLTA